MQVSDTKKVVIVLEKACLETVKTKHGVELITADTHASILKKLKKDPTQFRPDILHQCLLTLLDSPLNKAGHLQIYIHTTQNVLIQVSPHCRIPRTFKVRRLAIAIAEVSSGRPLRLLDTSRCCCCFLRRGSHPCMPHGLVQFVCGSGSPV